ncbi:MAG TPA: hypothetical protein VHW23_28500 [Kofleriaceae bacterium]|nr:hypothetical protein [Kofleriaceae bacterium]
MQFVLCAFFLEGHSYAANIRAELGAIDDGRHASAKIRPNLRAALVTALIAPELQEIIYNPAPLARVLRAEPGGRVPVPEVAATEEGNTEHVNTAGCHVRRASRNADFIAHDPLISPWKM